MSRAKRWLQTKDEIKNIISAGEGDLVIVSGEGENGSTETYEGEQAPGVIYNALKKERCGGDRWARIDTEEGHALMFQ